MSLSACVRHGIGVAGAVLVAVSVVAALPSVSPASDLAPPAVDGHYRGFGDRGGFHNILPPGQDGSLNAAEALAAHTGSLPRHSADQVRPYADLVLAVPGLSDDRLPHHFKDASFGVAPDDIAHVYSPFPDVTVVRDRSSGVPHIFGTTRRATMMAQGYTAAEDRLFLMDVLRHLGRARLSEFLGPSPANQAMDRAQLAVAPYTERDLTTQVETIAAAGSEGAAVAADLRAYAAGVNVYIAEAVLDPLALPAEYPALQQMPRPWAPEDTVAVAAYVSGRLGKGGGAEITNLCGIQAMAADLGAAEARRVFDDLHLADDPESSTTSSNAAPYPTGIVAVDPASQPDVDCSSLVPVDGGTPSLADLLDAMRGVLPPSTAGSGGPQSPLPDLSALAFPHSTSNALLVSADRAAGGRPLAVFGPQTGYFMPQALVEKDVHGPGISVRGAAFPGADLYVQMGRGADYAWSATSSNADNTDQVVLRLCDPVAGGPATESSMGEVRDGKCEPLETFQHVQVARPTAGGLPEGPDVVLNWRVERSASSGPVVARGRLRDGTPVAISSRRSTYGAELASAFGFRRLNDPQFMAAGFPAFRSAISGIDYTFNWFYVDDTDIGYQHSCRCPQRAPGVDPDLPAWGTGQWDWNGWVPRSAQPWDLNPAKGYMTSWNNRPAPGFRAADNTFNWGALQRVDMLDRRIEAALAAGPLTPAGLVDAMGDAATVDLRGERNLPLLLDALGPTPPPDLDLDPRVGTMRERLASWASTGAHRRDRDGDGAYDDAVGPAVLDAWWPRLVAAIFDRPSAAAAARLHLPVHDAPQNHHGSAFDGGFYSHVDKDLRTVLGHPVASPWSRAYCGGGDLVACRQILWRSLSQTADALENEFSVAGVDGWHRRVSDDQIEFSAVGLASVPPIPWVNRPTFQQVVQVGSG